MFGKTELEKIAIRGAESLGEGAVDMVAGPIAGELVSVIVNEVTKHVVQNGVTPDVQLLKTSIGQLIEGTVGVLQATGRIKPGVEEKIVKDVVKDAQKVNSTSLFPPQVPSK